MSKYLSYGGFEWLSQEEIKNFNVNSISKNRLYGYMLEVDLEYHDKLHDFDNDYPFYPEKLEISNGMLSRYCRDIALKYGIKIVGVNKLVPSLGNNSKYVVHYRDLQLYLPLGKKLAKINELLKFKQSDWMKTLLI